MKKKLFVFAHTLEIGGAERSLIGLLSSLDYTKNDVDLFLLKHDGPFMHMIPKEVNLLPENKQYRMLMLSLKEVLLERELLILTGRVLGKIQASIYNKLNKIVDSYVAIENIQKYTQAFLPIITNKHYDLAISFLTPHYIVANKVQAKQKIAWIHTDYSTIHVNQKSELKMWEQYDYIASISSDCTKAFTSVFPTLAAKIFEIENISLPSFIKAQAQLQTKAEIGYEDDFINFCTVGRFCYAKAYDRAIEVCERLVQKGYPIRWYAVGFGGDEAMMRSLVAEKQLENHFIIVGKQENPYPYIAHSDYYLQLSRYEGKAVTVREAQILTKPVMITNYATASSQITNGIDGIIVDNDNIEVMVEQISAFIADQQQQAEIVEYLQQTNYGNETEVMKIEKILGE